MRRMLQRSFSGEAMKQFSLALVFGLAVLTSAVLPAGRLLPAQSSTPLFYRAIRTNDIPLLKRAIAEGGLDTPDDRGRTPLMHAAFIGSVDAVRTLIEAGGKVNSSDASGMTPLMFGVRDIEKVRLLLQQNADPNAKTKQGQTALLIAASTSGSIEIIRALVAKGG